MAYDQELADRIRTALSDRPSLREVKMFGGLAFMVDDRMVVCAAGDGGLLVRSDPARSDELVAIEGAKQAEMAGRSMGPSWISVAPEATAGEGLDFWMSAALEHHAEQSGG
jgi:hypothetical protein